MRGGIKINRTQYDYETGERVDWLDAFAQRIIDTAAVQAPEPVNAVQQARARDQSMLEQITSIVSGRHNSVESKVREYQDKIGLNDYLRNVNADNLKHIAQKIAADSAILTNDHHELPGSFDRLPPKVRDDVKNFIRNKCETHHGNIQVPALVEDVSKTFRNAGIQPHDVNDQQFERYLNEEIIAAKKRSNSIDDHNVNIGLGVGVDIDDNVSDNTLSWLNPVKPNK